MQVRGDSWKEPRDELQKSHLLKFEELARKNTEDIEEVTSLFQGSNVKTVYVLGDNDAKYPHVEIDDEHLRNSPASPLYLQERESKVASLLQVYHSQKRELVSRCTVNFSKFVETRHMDVTKAQIYPRVGQLVSSGKKRTIARRSKIRDPETWIQSGSCRFFCEFEETNWFSSIGNWAYSNRVWSVQTRTSSTSRRIGRWRNLLKDVELVRSGQLFHYPIQPALFPLPCEPGGLLSRGWNLQHAWYVGKRFCKSTSVFFDNLPSDAQSLELMSLLREIFPVQANIGRPVIANGDRDNNRSGAQWPKNPKSFSIFSFIFWFLKRPSIGNLSNALPEGVYSKN